MINPVSRRHFLATSAVATAAACLNPRTLLARQAAAQTFVEADLKPWHAVRGVFLVDKDAFSVDAKTATGYYVTDPWLFVSYGATFAVIHDEGRHSLLYT